MTEINRYNNGKIYKLVSNETDKIYIGSTCKERLCQRLAKHKANYKDWIKDNNNGYISSYELFKLGNVEIVLLESINCNTKDELLKKEREYIDKYKDILVNNILKPIITKEEIKEHQKQYYKDNRNHILDIKKDYYEDNKEKLLKINKQYRKNNKEILANKGKEKYENNKEEIIKDRIEYYEKNKEEINQKRKQIYNCECGSSFRKSDKLRHEKSKAHQEYINSLQT